MCGIVGVLNLAPAERVDLDLVARMRDTMVHRGPDGHGIWTDDAGQVVLGHRRLSIIDLSTVANQPMRNEDEHGLGHLQRRDLQPPPGCAPSWWRPATSSAPITRTPR